MGRPRHDGDRYPSGDLKPDKEIAPALLARLKNDVVKFFGDAKLASQVSRLALLGQLTNRQAAAGLRLGEIHNRFRRLKRLRSSVKSPNYDGGFSGGADVAEERMSEEQLANLEEAIRKASFELDAVMEEIPVYPREVYRGLIDLCVEDQPVSSLLYPELRVQLMRLAHYFDSKEGKRRRQGRESGRRGVRPLRTAPKPQDEHAQPARKPQDAMLRAWEKAIKALRPDLDDAGVRKAKEIVVALVDREREIARKERASSSR